MKNGGLRTKGIKKYSKAGYPLVSVITVSYNAEDSLEQTIESVLTQEYENIEYIIIDGGSTDKTISVIEKYSDSIDYWISEPDKGIADAFNKGIALSNGAIIGIINADDWYEPDAVSAIIDNLLPYPAIYTAHMNLYERSGNKLFKLHKSQPQRLSQTMRVAHPSTFVDNSIYKLVGSFSTEYKSAMDYDFLLRARAYPFEIKVIDRVISNMRLGGVSNHLPMVLGEELKIKNNHLGRKPQHYIWYMASLVAYYLKSGLSLK